MRKRTKDEAKLVLPAEGFQPGLIHQQLAQTHISDLHQGISVVHGAEQNILRFQISVTNFLGCNLIEPLVVCTKFNCGKNSFVGNIDLNSFKDIYLR